MMQLAHYGHADGITLVLMLPLAAIFLLLSIAGRKKQEREETKKNNTDRR